MRGVHLQHIDHILAVALLNGELHVHQADHVQAMGHLGSLTLDLGHGFGLEVVRGSEQAESPE